MAGGAAGDARRDRRPDGRARLRRAAVIGGSIAGLFAALLLRRQGWDARVYERGAEALSARGTGIVTHPQLDRVLARAGIARPADFGVEVSRRVVLGRDGQVVARLECRQTMTGWDRLWRLLRGALPDEAYVGGAALVGVDGNRARFDDGRVVEAELIVGADGLRSSVRAAMVGEVRPVYAGYTAWRGLVGEAALPRDVHAALFGTFAFCLPAGEQMLGYPVAGAANDLRPGHRRYNWVWYRPADEAGELAALLTDGQGRRHAISIPPPLIRPEAVAQMRQAAGEVLAAAFASVVDRTEQPFLQPIYDLASPAMASGCVALVGDAAFVARPHVGAGATKAAEDALALAEALAAEDDVAAALRRYEAVRRPAGERIVRRARHLGAYMQAALDGDEQHDAAARHRTPQAVLAETAVLTF